MAFTLVRPEAFFINPYTKTWEAAVPIEDDDLIGLASRRALVETLDLSRGGIEGQIDITDRGWAAVAKLPLREIKLTRAMIRDSGLKLISKIPTLNKIELTDTNITDEGIKALINTPLTKLNLDQCIFISNHGAHLIAQMKGLRTLTISGTEFTDEGLKQIAASLNLTELKLNGCSKITTEGLKSLALCKTLRILQIGSNRIDANTIRSLKTLPLEDLDVAGCKGFDNQCLEIVVSQWPRLTNLKIDQTEINGKALAALSRLGKLESLNVSSLRLTDKTAASTAKLLAVRSLNLSDNDITDSTVLALRPLRELRRVSLNKCARVTKTAVKSLEKSGKKVDYFALIKANDLHKDMIENLGVPTE